MRSDCKRSAQIIQQMRDFVDQVYVPDTIAIASFYKDWFTKGHGEGVGNFMTYGDFPAQGSQDSKTFMVPRGAILNRDLSHIQEVDLNAEADIQEFVAHSWYDYSGGKEQGLHPYRGETTLSYSGPQPPYDHLDTQASYSWLKSPRWKGHAMEVGPLARVLMLYASGHAPTRELADKTLKQLDLPLEALFSTMGRTAARTLECKIFADAMPGWFDSLMANIKAGDARTFNEKLWAPSTWPRRAQGRGFRRGAARLSRALDRDREREDRELPGGSSHDVECRSARCAGAGGARMKRHSRGRRWSIASSPWRSCALSIVSIRAWPAPCTCSIRMARN